ncbi:jg14087 [Pararge aegeria aegeria]|uniref:Jg14087 protein n=1 Tax=Pararge aegeria aegeria TaxID=348720 RepID=A0A8S4QVT7_9NEOP|nr:jg14087 [Pararge aegeria aegeria]
MPNWQHWAATSGAKSRGGRGHRPAPGQTLPSPPTLGETISLKNPARRSIEVNLDDLSRRLYRRVGAPRIPIHNSKILPLRETHQTLSKQRILCLVLF